MLPVILPADFHKGLWGSHEAHAAYSHKDQKLQPQRPSQRLASPFREEFDPGRRRHLMHYVYKYDLNLTKTIGF